MWNIKEDWKSMSIKDMKLKMCPTCIQAYDEAQAAGGRCGWYIGLAIFVIFIIIQIVRWIL